MARFSVGVTRRQAYCQGGFHVEARDEAEARGIVRRMLDGELELPEEYWSGEVERDAGEDTIDWVKEAEG